MKIKPTDGRGKFLFKGRTVLVPIGNSDFPVSINAKVIRPGARRSLVIDANGIKRRVSNVTITPLL